MITEAERRKIAKLILTSKDSDLLEKMKELLFSTKKVSKAYVKRYNNEIEEAEREMKAGNFLTAAEADELLEARGKK